MPSKKKAANRKKREPLSGTFTILVLLSIASFIIGVFSSRNANTAYSFIVVALLLLIIAVLAQYSYSRKKR